MRYLIAMISGVLLAMMMTGCGSTKAEGELSREQTKQIVSSTVDDLISEKTRATKLDQQIKQLAENDQLLQKQLLEHKAAIEQLRQIIDAKKEPPTKPDKGD